jgi:hypothetical protein
MPVIPVTREAQADDKFEIWLLSEILSQNKVKRDCGCCSRDTVLAYHAQDACGEGEEKRKRKGRF